VHLDSSKKRRMTRSDKYFQANDKAEEGGPLQSPDREVSLMVKPTLMEIPSSKERKLKGKKLVFSPPVAVETIKSRRPFTRSTTKQHVPMEDDTTEASAQQKDKF
jgi:hypothetical protein